ncbi:MAG: hypothetical protein MJZ76_02520 [Bacteroidales bacterium]|nr:hypothetical protein [Bacteroidales bacterium]
MKRTWVFTLVFATVCGFLSAQSIDTAHFKLEYDPQLLDFKKINNPAVITDTFKKKVSFDYYITPQRLDVSFEPAKIKPLKVIQDPQRRLYQNFLKVGFGYPITPLAELALHNGINKKYSYGLNVHHFSSWAKPIGKTMKQYGYAPTSDTKADVYFSRFFKNQTLYSSIGYSHEAARYYGFEVNELDSLRDYYTGDKYKDTLKHNFHHLRAEVGVRSNYGVDDKKLKQDVRLNYDGIFANFHDMENHLGLRSFFAYDAPWLKLSGSQLYRMNLNFDYYRNSWNRGDSMAISSNSYNISPEFFAHWTFGDYRVKIGFGMSFAKAGLADTLNDPKAQKMKFTIYPMAELQLGVISGIMSIYADLGGGAVYNSYQSLLYENPFVKPHLQDLRFTRNWVTVQAGIKGNLVKKLNYNLFAKYSYSEDMLFYVTDTLAPLKNQFDVAYSDGGCLNVGLNVNWEVLNNLTLHFDADYWYYHVDEKFKEMYGRALYKPALEFAFSGDYVLNDMLVFNLNFDLGFMAYEWKLNKETNLYETTMMKPILDFGLGVEWLITKRFTAFLDINNVACQHYAQFYNYKSNGINAIIGVTYRFGEPKSMEKKKLKKK